MAAACGLVQGLSAGQVIADRAYDAHQFHDVILDQGGKPVIPPRRHRRYQHAYDKIAYRNRWGICTRATPKTASLINRRANDLAVPIGSLTYIGTGRRPRSDSYEDRGIQ